MEYASVRTHEVWISPTGKGDNNQDPANFRPIALTCVACKVYERVWANRLKHEMRTRPEASLSESQFGYTEGKSTAGAIAIALQTIEDNLCCMTKQTKSYVKRAKAGAIFIDYSHAFDTVCRYILLNDLIRKNISRYYKIR